MGELKVRENKESEYQETRKFLAQLESISGQVSEHEISDRIKNYEKERFEENTRNILLWEQMAFDFCENYPEDKSGWGTYFGPMFVLPNKERKLVQYPSIHKVTSEIISYWEERAKESNHPVFRARYSNLVWDFSEKIKREKPHFSIAKIFVDSAIEIAEKDLHKYPTNVIKKLERALSLALTINDKEHIAKIKNIIICYENKIAKDAKLGTWGFSYELLIKNKKVLLTEDEEKEIIRALEQRFERLLKGNDIWAPKRAVELLVDYYNREEKSEEVKNILLKLGNMIQQEAEKVSVLEGSAWLEELYHLYLQHGLKKEADNISIRIRELEPRRTSELEKIETSVEISNNEIAKFIKKLIEGDIKTALTKTAIYYIPRKGEVIRQLKDISEKAPISFLLISKTQDHEGRVEATVGPLEEDIDGHIVLQISQDMQITSIFLRETINALIHKFSLNVATIVDYLFESPIFDEKRKEFFIKGIEAYLNGNFFVALHILIPQIETLIRNLAEKIGVNVLKKSRGGGFNYKTLDELLRDENIIKGLSEDLCLYLRILLSDQRGWNLRNNICHGISSIETFDQIAADRVFHALLCLSLVKEKAE